MTKFTDLVLSTKQAQEQGRGIRDIFKKAQPTQTFQEQYPEIKRKEVAPDVGIKALRGISNFTKSILQETARSGGSIGLAFTGRKELKPEAGLLGKIQKFIFGERPLESIPTRIERLPERAKEFGIPETISKPLAIPAILGLTALDFTGWGGRAKTLSTLTKATKTKEVIPVLKKIGVADNLIDDIAKKVIKTTDVNEIKSLLKTTPDVVSEVKPAVKFMKEARKYKTAEEFFLRMNKTAREELRKQGVKSQVAIKEWFNKNITPKEQILDNLNPTGGLYVDYTPQQRMTMKLGDNITTLDKTTGKSADEMITIYRGAPKIQKEIVAGDFITTNYDLAKHILIKIY